MHKRVKLAQESGPHEGTSISGTKTLIRTLKNHLCGLLVIIPYDCIVTCRKIGKGTYGKCTKAIIDGTRFFPPSITCYTKELKGHKKIEQFSKEKIMQILNASLIRCVACTSMAPWVSVFPLYNRGTVHCMLYWLPYKCSSYTLVCKRLERVVVRFRAGPDFHPYELDLAHIR